MTNDGGAFHSNQAMCISDSWSSMLDSYNGLVQVWDPGSVVAPNSLGMPTRANKWSCPMKTHRFWALIRPYHQQEDGGNHHSLGFMILNHTGIIKQNQNGQLQTVSGLGELSSAWLSSSRSGMALFRDNTQPAPTVGISSLLKGFLAQTWPKNPYAIFILATVNPHCSLDVCSPAVVNNNQPCQLTQPRRRWSVEPCNTESS